MCSCICPVVGGKGAKMRIYRAPCRNYDGYTLVKIVDEGRDTWGQPVLIVQALTGEPWDYWTHGGSCGSNRNAFYPDALIFDHETEKKIK